MRRVPKNPESKDISAALSGWSFEPGQVNVRIIRGSDGKAKIQLRLDLGLLQMEVSGRPDGKRPHRYASELDFQIQRLKKHRATGGSDADFQLTARDCRLLRDESSLFYHRYLSLFVLGRYDGVVRDTRHNIAVLDLCHQFGPTQFDRQILEQYRPYIVMMEGRARACAALRDGFVNTAIAYLRGTLKNVIGIYGNPGAGESPEALILSDMIHDIRRQLPPDPRAELNRLLKKAVAGEKYEEAAQLRDQLMAMHTAGVAAGKPAVRTAAARRPVAAHKSRRKVIPDSQAHDYPAGDAPVES
ncbi:MAG: UvrB/UvrC motif-containing protein [Phycisphaerae bacterium]